MLALLFSAGPHRCALPCRSVREVISCVTLQPLAGAPRHLAGVFSYRGVVTPVADFCLMQSGKPCANRLSSRILLFDYALAGGVPRPVGLLAERVTETRQLSAQGGAVQADLPFVGRVVVDAGEMIHLLDSQELLQRAFSALPELTDGGAETAHAALENRQ
ncbi:MAG TPA: chemotaxis protein CheW [Polyangiaceae bacterium]|jgi:chemotaxis-related protein WspB|nr:chemotaxis protein CheW [Polyangiaceae bacterium]